MVKTTNLRLNLDKPDHRKAYEILQNSDKSYSKTIVAALISFSENEENRKHLFDGIREIVNLSTQKKYGIIKAMRYTSDLTDAQWEQIKEYFPAGNKSKYDKRELVNAVLYLVKTGGQWRNLPKDFPNWKAVSMFYYRAQKKGVWDKILKMLVKKTRTAQGRN